LDSLRLTFGSISIDTKDLRISENAEMQDNAVFTTMINKYEEERKREKESFKVKEECREEGIPWTGLPDGTFSNPNSKILWPIGIHILWLSAFLFPFLICCTKKNLATLLVDMHKANAKTNRHLPHRQMEIFSHHVCHFLRTSI
jgi:hypothetical protein